MEEDEIDESEFDEYPKIDKSKYHEIEPFDISTIPEKDRAKFEELLKPFDFDKYMAEREATFKRLKREIPEVKIVEPEGYEECVVIQDNHDGEMKIVKQEAEMLERLRSQYQIEFSFTTGYMNTTTYSEQFKWALGDNLDQNRYTMVQMKRWASEKPHHLYSLQLKYPHDFNTDTAHLPSNPMTELPPEFATSFQYLQNLSLDWIPLTSLQNLPLVQYLSFKDAHFADLYSFPSNFLQLIGLSFNFCRNLMSLAGLPREMPNLERLVLWYTPIQSLDNLPKIPSLKNISCKNVQIKNFAGFSELKKARVSILHDPYSFISLFGIPKPVNPTFPNWFDKINYNIRDLPGNFPVSYLSRLDLSNNSREEILDHFAAHPSALAMKYINNEVLSEFEQDRIVAEGTLETLHVMIQHLPPTDPLLKSLAQRWNFNLFGDNSNLLL
jgi:hypothetical protein